jgi:hypothetical protein
MGKTFPPALLSSRESKVGLPVCSRKAGQCDEQTRFSVLHAAVIMEPYDETVENRHFTYYG